MGAVLALGDVGRRGPQRGRRCARLVGRTSTRSRERADDEPRVLVAFSKDAGASFGDPSRADDGQALGRVDVDLLPDGSALVIWMATSDEGAAVLARRVRADGTMSEIETVGYTDGSRSSGFPRMALRGEDLIVAWTDTAGEGSIRTAIVTPSAPER